jgi:uncharacterized protein (DUF1330 family)
MIRIYNQADLLNQKLTKKKAKATRNAKKFLHFLTYKRVHDAFKSFRYKCFIKKREDATKRIMI